MRYKNFALHFVECINFEYPVKPGKSEKMR